MVQCVGMFLSYEPIVILHTEEQECLHDLHTFPRACEHSRCQTPMQDVQVLQVHTTEMGIKKNLSYPKFRKTESKTDTLCL